MAFGRCYRNKGFYNKAMEIYLFLTNKHLQPNEKEYCTSLPRNWKVYLCINIVGLRAAPISY